MKILPYFFITAAIAHTSLSNGFQGLGDLPGGTFSGGIYSIADGVSGDGATVVGFSSSTAAGGLTEAFRWAVGGGMVGIGDIAGGSFNSVAASASFNGAVIAGSGSSASGSEAFRWTSATGAVGIGDLSGGVFNSYSQNISADGTTIVGASNSASVLEAFKWTSASGMVGLGDFAGGSFSSEATGVSSDGSVIVGYSNRAAGDEAFRWTSANGLVGLGILPGGTFSIATEVSDDGNTIVGWGPSASGPSEAFRWTLGSGMVALGDLAGGSFNSYAADVSNDGSIVVGYGFSATGKEATVWDASHGMRSLKTVLTADYGVTGLESWTLTEARGISADGQIIVGYGINPSGKTEAWIASVPEPSSFILILSGAILFLRCRSLNFRKPAIPSIGRSQKV